MNGRPEIRAAGAEDIGAVTAIYAEAVMNGTASYEIEPPGLEEMTRRWRAVLDAGYPYLVAERSDAVLGFAYASAFRSRPAYRYLVEDSVYIAKDARGTGLGALLLRRLIADCQARGFRQMIAVIGDGSRQVGSVRLHEKFGFERVGTLSATGFKFGRWLDTLIMQRALGAGATSGPEQPAGHIRSGAASP